MALATTPAAPPPLLPAAKSYTLMLRTPGLEGWHTGVTVSSAFAALTCQNYIRRNHSAVAVKILGR